MINEKDFKDNIYSYSLFFENGNNIKKKKSNLWVIFELSIKKVSDSIGSRYIKSSTLLISIELKNIF